MPSALTGLAPPLPSTVTVPAAPPKMAKPGCGFIGAETSPVASVQFGAVVDHTPLPPPIWVALARPLAFQKFSVRPVVLSRLICLFPVRYWIDRLSPAGVVPSVMPPWVSVSVPP